MPGLQLLLGKSPAPQSQRPPGPLRSGAERGVLGAVCCGGGRKGREALLPAPLQGRRLPTSAVPPPDRRMTETRHTEGSLSYEALVEREDALCILWPLPTGWLLSGKAKEQNPPQTSFRPARRLAAALPGGQRLLSLLSPPELRVLLSCFTLLLQRCWGAGSSPRRAASPSCPAFPMA